MSEPAPSTQRLFFALWPDPEVRRQLAEVSHRSARRPVADENLHLTLAFLGDRSCQERDCFCEAASRIQGEPFELQMDYLGVWPRPGIQWLGTRHMPESLLDFYSSLQRALVPCGYEPEKRRFVPHVTLARKVRRPQVKADVDAIHWPVNDFVLVESVPDEGRVRYEVLERWPLAGSL